MPSKAQTYKATLQLICDILSFENSNGALEQKIKSGTIDWEQFVIVASDYLVLTTCYCRLKEKKILQYLPEDLSVYLKEITLINRNRNQTLLSEITHISEVLKANDIEHVFLKGSAFLVKNLYEDTGERMLGDIDILVDEKQLNHTYDLLIDNGYRGTEKDITSKYFDFKHLPRLQSDKYLAAVEVHRKLTLQPYHGLLSSVSILAHKQNIEGVFVPKNDHLLYHTVLNFQANDLGYTYSRMSPKSIYDVLILKNTYKYDFSSIIKLPYFRNYFSIAKVFFEDFSDFKSNTFIDRLFILKLKYPIIRRLFDWFIRKSKYLKVIISSRILFFFKNKNYRKDIFKDYKRILGIRKLKKS